MIVVTMMVMELVIVKLVGVGRGVKSGVVVGWRWLVG